MKRTLQKIIAITFLAALMAGAPTNLRADDSTTAKPATPAAPDSTAGPTKFYGPVTAVDTNAMTFTVGEQTFTITGETAITRDNKKATIADAVVGEPARGTYTKTSSGKLDVTKVRFGKKTGGKGKKKNKNSDTADAATSTNQPAASKPGE